MKFLSIRPGDVTHLPSYDGLPERAHEFDARSIGAVNAALAAKRPLLIRGEPGIGKTQLAEAVAVELNRAFFGYTVDSRTESRDLLWHFDAIMRLAQAQLYGALRYDQRTTERELAVSNFVYPGPLWWAFDTASALAASHGDATPLTLHQNQMRQINGWVLLIDEIDKAESDVPNGLLEALGAGQFTPLGYEQPVRVSGIPPLILITTNQERALPDAFIRRCLVLPLELPVEREALIACLKQRGRSHFGAATTEAVLTAAAEQLVSDRHFAQQHQLRPLPGQAEYLDLVRAVIGLAKGDLDQQQALIDEAAAYTLQKHDDMWSRQPEVRS
jgi:MoxR-like ATPase